MFGSSLDDYLHLLVPPVVKLFDSSDIPLSVRRSAIPLTNRIRGPYCKLRTEFFPFAYGPSAKRAGHKSTGKNEDIIIN